MIKSKILYVIPLLSMFILTGCYTSNRLVSSGCNEEFVSTDWVEQVTHAAHQSSVQKQLMEFEKLVSSQSCQNDPVVLNYYGLSLIRAGQHQTGFEQIRRAAELVDAGVLQQSTHESRKAVLQHSSTRSGNNSQSNESLILKLFRDHFETASASTPRSRIESDLVDELMNRPGFPPFPPYFPESGTPGVILEILNEIYPNHFRPEYIWYIQPDENSEHVKTNSIAAVRSNIVLAGVLGKDPEMIDVALSEPDQIRTTNYTARTKFALGLYMKNQNPDRFTTISTRSLFQ